VCERERGVPKDADSVLKLQLMGKWISVLDYSGEQGSRATKSDNYSTNIEHYSVSLSVLVYYTTTWHQQELFCVAFLSY